MSLRVQTSNQATYLSFVNEEGKIENKNIFLYAKPGYGKSLACETAVEEFHRAGYTVLILSDVKDEFESAFCMFPPMKKYHLDALHKVGKPINSVNAIVHHPFTFSIPTKKALPEIDFYSFSLKEHLNREVWSMIAESEQENETIRLLMNASNAIKNTDGLYAFVKYVENSILKSSKKLRADPTRFFAKTKAATAKTLQDIVSFLSPFEQHYFLHAQNSPHKIDMSAILQDNKNIHVFSTKWIPDRKLKTLNILILLQAILQNRENTNNPVLVYIPEIRYLCREGGRGYEKYLGEAIRSTLTMARAKGIGGMSFLFDSQVWSDVSYEIKLTGNVQLYGELGDAKDIELLSKALKYGREKSDRLVNSLMRNSYMIQGREDMENFYLWMPGFGHFEEEYSFENVYRARFKERMQIYAELVKKVSKMRQEEREFYRNVSLKEEQEELKEKEEKDKVKELKSKVVESKTEIKKKEAEWNEKTRLEKIKKVGEKKESEPDISWRELGRQLNMDSKTAQKYWVAYQQRFKQEENRDIEENVLEEMDDVQT